MTVTALNSNEKLQSTSTGAEEAHKSSIKDASTEETLATVPAPLNKDESEEWEYVTGFKLHVVVGAVTLAAFVLLLDTAIIATVCLMLSCWRFSLKKV